MKHVARALASRNYRLFFAGQVISLVGTWMQSVAQSWLVYRLTGSTGLLGLIAFCNQIPVFFLASVGGALADRVARRRVLVGTQTAAMVLAFVLAALTLTGVVRTRHVFVLSTLLGIVNAIDMPARQSFVVELVGSEHQMNAIALNSSMVTAARVVGPAIAGLVVAAIGEGWCFLVNGISFLAVIAGLLAMHDLPAPPARPEASAFAHLVEGFRFVLGNAPIRAPMLLLGIASLFGMPYVVLMPVFADRIVGGGARTLGILMAASGVGALVAAVVLARRSGLKGLLSRWVAPGALGFGVAVTAFAWSRSLPLSCLFVGLAGLTMMMQTSATNTLVQAMTPSALRGRVMAFYSMMFLGVAPLGALSAGIVAEHVGVSLTLTIGGAVCAAMGVAFRIRVPVLAPRARDLIQGTSMAAGQLARATASDAGAH